MRETYVAAKDRYEDVPYARCGRSGLLLPKISLGLWHNFGFGTPFERQQAIVRRAFDRGVTYFDLANNYGPPYGSAEENFGRIFASDFRSHRDEMIIASKAGYDMWEGPYGEWPSRKNMLASLDQSLKRLQVDYVDIFYAHRPSPDIPIEETAGALATAYQSGKALYVGISNYMTSKEVKKVVKALREWNIPLTINQLRFSMLDRRIENGVLDTLEKAGAGVAVFSPLEQGLLTDRYLNGVPKDSRAFVDFHLKQERVNEKYLRTVRSLQEVAASRGQTLAQLALAWVLKDPRVTTAIVGASSVEQLDTNLDVVESLEDSPLTTGQIEATERSLQVPVQRAEPELKR